MSVLFIIPAYNEEPNLPTLFELTKRQMAEWEIPYRMVIVDDGSRDRTAAIVEEFAAHMPATLVRHPVTCGVGEVFRTGIRSAVEMASPEDVVVFKEADNTSDPQILQEMLEQISRGGDVILASCYADGGDVVGTTWLRRLLSTGANTLLSFFFPVRGIKTYSSFYRAIRAQTLRAALEAYDGRLVEESGFTCAAEMVIKLANVGAEIREVPMVLRCDATKTPSKQNKWLTTWQYFKMFAREGIGKRWSRALARQRYAELMRVSS